MNESEWPTDGLSDERIGKLIEWLPDTFSTQILQNQRFATSLHGQDLFALAELGFKSNGFFVEFGAADGILFSNTYLLEKRFAWTGILAEPAKIWERKLFENRTAAIETRCVWIESDSTIRFKEVDVALLSTIDAFSAAGRRPELRKSGRVYDVETTSLIDLLDKHHAPTQIDFLSIDTEGSEFDILSSFDFDKYRFSVIVCEHNHTPMREEIYGLLAKKGYVRKYKQLSENDDWYVLSED